MRIECVSGRYFEEEWVRTIEMDAASSLFDVHETIQDAVDFDRDHLFEFFAAPHRRYRRRIEYADAYDWEGLAVEYDSILLEDIFPLPRKYKLWYHFDFGDDWYFVIRKTRKKPHEPEAGVSYPRVIDAVGPNPKQYGDWDEDW